MVHHDNPYLGSKLAIILSGSSRAIYIKGHYGHGPLYIFKKDKTWEEIKTPQHIIDDQPDVIGDTERNWQFLAREFVKDIKGETFSPYQTFKEVSLYQQLIDIIRENKHQTDVSYLQQP